MINQARDNKTIKLCILRKKKNNRKLQTTTKEKKRKKEKYELFRCELFRLFIVSKIFYL